MATIRVTNQTQLDSAIKAAKSGDTVVPAAGNYKQLWVDNKVSASAITFKSESATNPAVIGYARAVGSDGVVFQDLKIGREMIVGTDQDWTNMALVQDSKNVSFTGVQFFSTGSTDAFLGRGMFIRNGSNISVKNSEFSQLAVGMQSMSITGLVVQNNKFHDLRIDGAQFTAVKNVLIDGNDFRDFRSSELNHPDAIQFWTSGTKQASTDVVISNNVVMPGTGNGSQGIFMQDEIGGLPYERLTIKNNLILDAGNYWNGIAVRGGKDVTIEGNSTLSPTGDQKAMRIWLDKVAGVKLINNLSDQLVQSNVTGLQDSGNVFMNLQKTFASRISGINLGAKATVGGLIVPGVGYQAAAGTINPVAPAPAPKVQAPAPVAPVQPAAAVPPVVGSGTTPTPTTRVTGVAAIDTFQPSSLASLLTPIAAAPRAVVSAAPVVTAATTPTVLATPVVAPVLTARQQQAAAAAAAAQAQAQAQAAAAAAAAARSSRPGTSIALTPVVSQPVAPVAAAPITTFSTASFLNPSFGMTFLGRSL